MTIRLLCKQILLTAPGRNYEVNFEPGVNVVSGTIFTGKSSTMELIDYVCGAKTPLRYAEIKKCSDVLVHFNISGEEITIRRSLASSSAKAVIYLGTMKDALSGAAESMEVSWKHEKNKQSVSSELLGRLGIGRVPVKQAPTKAASDTNEFSLRDLMPFIYVDQDRMGIKPGFFENEFANFIKWQVGFQIIHGLHDAKATNISKLLKEAHDEEIELQKELRISQKFLEDSQVPAIENLQARLRSLNKALKEAEEESKIQQQEEIELLGEASALIEERESKSIVIGSLTSKESEVQRALIQLGRLRVQYEREFSQLEFLKESSHIISSIPISRCPACLQEASHSLDKESCYICQRQLPKTEEAPVVEGQLRSLKLRINDLENYTKQLTDERKTAQIQKTELAIQVAKSDREIEEIRKRAVFPKDRQILERASQVNQLKSAKEQCEVHLEMRYRARGDFSNLLQIQERINNLQRELDRRLAKRPKPDQILNSLSAHFSKILRTFRFPGNVETARLGEDKYLPIVREEDYKEIRSNGAIALIQCAFQFALLEFSLEGGSIFPRFLMLDSPLNHVGRSSSDPEFRDQKIVDAFYEYLHVLHEKYRDVAQIIICDNGPPAGVSGLPRIHFTGEKDNGRCGLIDDEYPTDDIIRAREERAR